MYGTFRNGFSLKFNKSIMLIICYTNRYRVKPMVCVRFGSVKNYTSCHHLPSGGKGQVDRHT